MPNAPANRCPKKELPWCRTEGVVERLLDMLGAEMTDGPTSHELSERSARLEERMKTTKAEYESALDRLRADMAGQKVWLFALVFGAVVTGIALGLAFSS